MAKKSLDSTENQKVTLEIEEVQLMKEQLEISDEIVLKDMEQTYRASLKSEPGNYEARAALARCLFRQWIVRTSCIQKGIHQDEQLAPSHGDVLQRGIQELEISRVLAECLHHALTTYYLSPSLSHRTEMKRMQSLVYKAGREGAIVKAKLKMDRAVACLMQEMMLDADTEIHGQTTDVNKDRPERASRFSVYPVRRKTAL